MNNTPKLMQSEEKRAPWNEKTKIVEVNISQCLSSTQQIEVPEDLTYDPVILGEYVRDQIMLPSDYLEEAKDYNWYIDDFCVI